MVQIFRLYVLMMLLMGVRLLAHHISTSDTIQFNASEASIQAAPDNSPIHQEPADLPSGFENQFCSAELPTSTVLPMQLLSKMTTPRRILDNRGIQLSKRLYKPPQIVLRQSI
ncbi:MAG: hypothetical protein JXR76_30850 [Deltaproteobacteria bacterium]|nr:hypothetical protein [Deltaproteobacteria bacterium]